MKLARFENVMSIYKIHLYFFILERIMKLKLRLTVAIKTYLEINLIKDNQELRVEVENYKTWQREI